MKKRPLRAKPKRDEGGQVILEFLLVCMMIFTLIFMFVQLAWGIAYGHYVHYATFMAARAYVSAGTTKQDQIDAATSTLSTLLKTSGGNDIVPFIAKARTGDQRDAKGPEPVPGAAMGMHSMEVGHEHSRAFSWAEGVQYNYNLKLFLLPLSTVITKDGNGNTIQPGSSSAPSKTLQWEGAIPFTSDAFLGRDPDSSECWSFMTRMSSSFGISRKDGRDFVEDNGC